MPNILIGTAALITTACYFLLPVCIYKNVKLTQALTKHSIIFCKKCNTYKVGKYSLCTECIKTFAQEDVTNDSKRLIKEDRKLT